jgi:hypothetical protein
MVETNQLAGFVSETIKSLSDKLVENRKAAFELNNYGKIFTLFGDSEVILNSKKFVTNNFWYTNTFDLINVQTSSFQNEMLKQFYLDAEISSSTYSVNTFFLSESVNKVTQFSVFYGDRFGSGSLYTNYYYPSKTTYKQFSNKCLEPEDDTFTFGDGINSDRIYGINFSQQYFKDGLNPSYFQLSLRELDGGLYNNSEHTGSNVSFKTGSYTLLTLIPDNTEDENILTQNGRVFNLVSGSISSGIVTQSNGAYEYYGLLYPDLGLAILDANRLDATLNFNSVTGSDIDGFNSFKLFKSIEGSVALNNGTSSISNIASPPANSFVVRADKVANVNYYFVNVRSFDYNYSTNPTYTTGSSGQLKYNSFINNPYTYISSVGLYNDQSDLLAIAKLSRPVKKYFGKEYLIKIKLEF